MNLKRIFFNVVSCFIEFKEMLYIWNYMRSLQKVMLIEGDDVNKSYHASLKTYTLNPYKLVVLYYY